MIVVLQPSITHDQYRQVEQTLLAAELDHHPVVGLAQPVLTVDGPVTPPVAATLRGLPGVSHLVPTDGGRALVTRAYRPGGTTVRVGRDPARSVELSHESFTVIAGPCAVESPGQLEDAADTAIGHGAAVLRGGAYKPRTSPYSFQGLGPWGLELLAAQRERHGVPVVTEVVEPGDVALVAAHADMLQIGARNMQSFSLLKEAGRSGVPVLLKRGLAATVDEWLSSAEYLLAQGNDQVVLCERGIRTHEPSTRFTLDLSAVPVVQAASHLPVVVDPSHAGGRADLVAPLALATAAAGADGVIVDVHTDPASALRDGAQALAPEPYAELVRDLDRVLGALGRHRTVTRTDLAEVRS